MQDTIEKLRSITNDGTLSPAQKRHFLSLEAENMLPYPALDAETREALDQIGYDGLFNYEVPGESRHFPGGDHQLLPLPVRLAKLEYAKRLAEAMLG